MYRDDLVEKTQVSLERLLPRLQPILAASDDRELFFQRLNQYFPTVFRHLYNLYGTHYDFFYHLEQILLETARLFVARPADLKALDIQREAEPLWFHHERMMGGVCYVDLFADNLRGIRERIPYFRELGLTYLHLMPLFKAPDGNSDGGYAVSSYRDVNPALGTISELAELARAFRAEGISLVVDFVFNHTSDEHDWALKALAGDLSHQQFYYMYDNRDLPDQYERNLREIFPEQAPGSFSFRPEINKWVWTTFNTFQWDLNYSNPAVFNAMLGEMLSLANNGVEILRLDAVAFIWKQMGTSCENLPQVHWIIQCYNALTRIAAPAMLFKSEAIVHPADVVSYVSWGEAPISYNPTLMALGWEALATREVRLLRHSMERRFAIQPDCAWVNYVRSHDDIGWTFADEDALEIGINGYDHRQFLNRFYSGRFAGSFAKGLPFNYNPVNQDMRISGTTAALAGLEAALQSGDSDQIEYGIRRILMLYSIALSAGGIPLLYLGDEIATTNDYDYGRDPAKAEDSRWAHRPRFDWARAEQRKSPTSLEGRVFQPLVKLIQTRKQTPALAGGQAVFFDSGNKHILTYVRGNVLVLVNFSDFAQTAPADRLRSHWQAAQARDLVSGKTVDVTSGVTLEPFTFLWLQPS